VASEKQIAANRRNAQKSTGPKTAAGRSTSSRNAFRYGLSLPLIPDAEELAKAELMMRMLVPDQTDDGRVRAASEMVEAQLVQMRVGAIRNTLMNTLMAKLNPASVKLAELRRLAALDRYEARALTKRRRPSRKLQS
jgi:hypothetical protein